MQGAPRRLSITFPGGKGWLALVTALICVGAALLVAVVVLAVGVVRLRAREGATTRAVGDLSLSLKDVRNWVEDEIRSLRSEFTVARVDASAAELARRGKPSAAARAPNPEPDAPKVRDEPTALNPPATSEKATEVGADAALEEEPTTFWTREVGPPLPPLLALDAPEERDERAVPPERTTLVPDGTTEEAPVVGVAPALEGDPTFVWTREEADSARAAAEVGGAHRSPQDVPRVPVSGAVAPPASAPALLSLAAASVASNQGWPMSAGGVPPAPRVPLHTDGATTEADEADADDTTKTRAFDKAAMAAALGAGAGGATPNPLSVPRAVYSGSVAPPASAPPPLPPEPGLKAASLGTRPQGPHGARPPTPLHRTRTIAGMPAVLGPLASTEGTLSDRSAGPKTKREGADRSTHTPVGSASRAPVTGVEKTQLSMRAQAAVPTSLPPASNAASFFFEETDEEREHNRDTAELIFSPPAPKPGEDDDPATEVIDVDPQALHRALSQPAHEESHGFDGVPQAAPGRHFSRPLETPRTSRLPEQEASK